MLERCNSISNVFLALTHWNEKQDEQSIDLQIFSYPGSFYCMFPYEKIIKRDYSTWGWQILKSSHNNSSEHLVPTAIFNSLAPGKFEWNFRYLILQIISVIDGWGISCELALRWMSRDLTDDKSTLVHVMAWCRQAASHYLSQCWPRSLSPYGITRPQWVNNIFKNLVPGGQPGHWIHVAPP